MKQLRGTIDGATFGAISVASGGIIVGIIIGVLGGVINAMISEATEELMVRGVSGAISGTIFQAVYGVIFGAIGGAVGGIIGVGETSGWVGRGAIYGAMGGLAFVPIALLLVWVSYGVTVGVTVGILFIVVSGVISGAIGGLICKAIANAGTIRQLTTRQYVTTLAMTGFPIMVGLWLLTVYPGYVGKMIYSCDALGIPDVQCTQPCGWIMIALFVACVVVSNVGIMGKLALRPDPANRLIIFLVLMLFVFPALAIIVLGPAILIVMETFLPY